MNPFAQYGHKATTVATPRLVGVNKTRSAARARYIELVAELEACEDADMLECFLASIAADIAQFRSELEFLWDGEHDFPGLKQEIERARARLDGCRDHTRF